MSLHSQKQYQTLAVAPPRPGLGVATVLDWTHRITSVLPGSPDSCLLPQPEERVPHRPCFPVLLPAWRFVWEKLSSGFQGVGKGAPVSALARQTGGLGNFCNGGSVCQNTHGRRIGCSPSPIYNGDPNGYFADLF